MDTSVGALRRAVVLVIIASAPIFLRPLINDDSTYALIGRKLAHGYHLYVGAVDNKPPFIYWTFAAGFRLVDSVVPAKLLSIAANVLSVLLLFRFTRSQFGQQAAGIASFVFACAIVTGVAEDSIAPNTEGFANSFVLLALALAGEAAGDRPGIVRFVLVGASVACAMLYRPHAAAVLVPLALLPAARELRLLPARGLSAAAGAALVFGLTGAYLASTGALDEAWFWVIGRNQGYLSSGVADGFSVAKLGRIGLAIATFLPLIAYLVLGGRALARNRWPGARKALPLAVGLAITLASYLMGFRFYGHYLIPALPFAAMLAGWAVTEGQVTARASRWLAGAMLLWAVAFAVVNVVQLRESAKLKALAQVADHIRGTTTPQAQVLAWGAPAPVILGSQRNFATRFPSYNQITGQVFGTRHVRAQANRNETAALEDSRGWQLLQQDLAASPPEVIVDGAKPAFRIETYPQLTPLLQSHYGPPVEFEDIRVYHRRAR